MLSPERKGEIALALVKVMIKKERFQLDASQMIRDIGNKVATDTDFKEAGISKEEAIEFVADTMKDVFRAFVDDLQKVVESGKVSQ